MCRGANGSVEMYDSTHTKRMKRIREVVSEIMVMGVLHERLLPRSRPTSNAKTAKINEMAPQKSTRRSFSRHADVFWAGRFKVKNTAMNAARQTGAWRMKALEECDDSG